MRGTKGKSISPVKIFALIFFALSRDNFFLTSFNRDRSGDVIPPWDRIERKILKKDIRRNLVQNN